VAMETSELIDGLSEAIGETLERKRAAKAKVPDVYASGMRGNEDPPAVRKEKEAQAKLAAKKLGLRKGVNPDKVAKTQKGREVVDDEEEESDEIDPKTGKKKVAFTAGPSKKALAKENAKLKAQLAELTKKKK
jgi:hypothetical protein